MKIFGENVFNDSVMRERLPKPVYQALRTTIAEGLALDDSIADVVANAMKEWAVERGATHFTHWFQPMTGVTAEKHDSFITFSGDGKVMMEFSGKELIMGEPDASSFPSGGLRATFEARGYTAWDCTSPAFLRKDAGMVTLCIPTVFCSYTGEVLDKKTPLLKSMEALSRQAMRVLRLFGNDTAKRVISTVGPEQEYFLIDQKYYHKREDLLLTGRTLFGAMPPKGQEMEDHYFGTIKERVAAFMKELNTELWKLGVKAKTQHNEVAPGQFEIAAIYDSANIATDHNQLVMDYLKKVASRHGLVCLLHEKPFAGVNGSGKHNNWSLATDDGQNLLEPGSTPHANAQFLLFLCAVVKAVDDYAGLLRASCANAGNDHRLGANEAPPAIISVFLGEQLNDIFEQLGNGGAKTCKDAGNMSVGVTTLPPLPKDTTDRNRTSPFAFTGNKFEFRMVPSSISIAGPNFVLNTIVSEALRQLADRLETAQDFRAELQGVLKEIANKHKRIVFNGNNYTQEWVREAKKRGLPNIVSTVEALPVLIKKETIDLFERHKVLNKAELEARYEISLERYCKEINIEALTMLDMAKRRIMPAVIKYASQLGEAVNKICATTVSADVSAIEGTLEKVLLGITELKEKTERLEKALDIARETEEILSKAEIYHDKVFQGMLHLRNAGDKLEEVTDAELWPLPVYTEMLFDL